MIPYLKREYRSIEGKNTYEQTIILFKLLEPYLHETIRTWIFIKDIDNTYNEMVEARNNIFDKHKHLFKNHSISSTGVGKSDYEFYPGEFIHLDALIVPGLKRTNLSYMSNIDIFPNTTKYGVRFERGTIYKTKKCSYFIVSGTASIDKNGDIKHPNNIKKQTYHAIDNMDKLLFKYGENINHANEIIGYVRNLNDIKIVKSICNNIFPNIKWIIKESKICRPGWLVEFETIIKSNKERL